MKLILSVNSLLSEPTTFSGMKLSNEQFPALTGVRAIAAFMVFFHHLPFAVKPDFLVGLQLSFFWGVTLFFVLSGFLITYRYYDTMELSRKWFTRYFINRFARIYPVYFLILTVVILFLKNTDPVFLIQNYTLSHNLFFLFPSHGLAITPSWSLTVEECFYILAPFIFLLCKKYNSGVPFLCTLLLLILILLTYRTDMPFEKRLFSIVSGTFFGHCVEFFAGIFLALFLLKRKTKELKSSKRIPWTLAGITGIVILLIPLIYVTNKEDGLKHSVMMLVNNLLLPLPIIMLYYGLISENSRFRTLLSGRIMRLLGRASYSFYLLHFPLINYLGTRQHFGEPYYNLYVVLIFLLTIVLSVIVFLFFEDPLNGFIRKSFRSSPAADPQFVETTAPRS